MAELKLKRVLKELKLPQKPFAASCAIGDAAFNLLINHAIWPKTGDNENLKGNILEKLLDAGATDDHIQGLFKAIGDSTISRQPIPINHEEYEAMLLRKQTVLPATRKKFSLFRDPFRTDDVTEQDDVFLTPSIRYVREALYQTARLGGFVAVIGESGSGKSTLRKDMITRLFNENQSVTMVEPFVLGMEDNDKAGKRLNSAHIAEAVIYAIDPLARPKSSAEAKFRQMHSLLLESYKAGNKHCLIIEEAHGLAIPTLKHLKRFYELEHGFSKLISIILIGQPELHQKLSERNPSVREVVQRCEVVTLDPLDNFVQDYLVFKCARAGIDAATIFDDSAYAAMQNKLTLTGEKRQRHSLLYPLAINNLAAAAMNLATELFETKVTSDVVLQVN